MLLTLLLSVLPLSSVSAATWPSPYILGQNGSILGGSPVFAQTGALSGVVAYAEHDDEAGFTRLFVRRTTDGGLSWADPVLVSGPYEASHPAIANDGQRVYLIWLEGGIKFRRSADGGLTWRATRGLASYARGIWPSISTFGGKIAVTWSSWDTKQVLVRISKDRGGTFSPADKIGTSTAGGRAAVGYGDGILYVAWWTDEYSTRLSLRRSTNNGRSWKPTVRLANGLVSQHVAAATKGARAVIAYGALSDLGVRSRGTIDRGANWSSTTVHSQDEWNGGIAVTYADDAFHIAYGDMSSGEPKLVYRSSLDGLSWGVPRIVANGLVLISGVGRLDGHPLVFYSGTEAQHYRAMVRRAP